jgi:predicted permease
MDWLRGRIAAARSLLRRGATEREMEEELRFHMEMEAQKYAREGMAPEEARRRATIAFGGVERHKEELRDGHAGRWAESLLQDLRYATRVLRRNPGFTLSSVLVLALGIGSTTAVFSAVEAVLLDPRYDRLAIVFNERTNKDRGTLSDVDFLAIQAQQRSFSAVGGLRWRDAGFSAGGEPQRVRAGAATSGFFRALAVRPARGRAIEPADERPGAPPVALASHALAMRSLGGEAAAMGRSVMLDGISHTIVGVLPRGVSDLAGVRADIWPALQIEPPTRRGPYGMRVVARLADGATFVSAERDLLEIGERTSSLWNSGQPDRSTRLAPVPMREALLGDVSGMLAVFAAAVALVLVIAVANVASLMLVRSIGRWREVSLRATLGATRVRLIRLLVTESVVLAAVGAAAGILLGSLGLRALIALGPRLPQLAAARLDARAVAFGVAVALLAGVVVAAAPVALLLRGDPSAAVQGGRRTTGDGRGANGVRSAFVVAQFALALPLLAMAGLLLNSFVRLQRVDPGFEPGHVLTASVSLPAGRYGRVGETGAYWARALPRVAELPGVLEAGLGSSMPPDDGGASLNNFDLVDQPVPPDSAQPQSPWPWVSQRYFAALGITLVEGRLFFPTDTGAAPVVVVSRSWARRFYPNGNALGRTLVSGGCTACPLTTVVGVVEDVRYGGLDGTAEAVYTPLTEGWPRNLNLFVRTAGSPADAEAAVRAALRSVDPAIPLDDLAPMEDRLYASVAQPRHWTALLGGFAAAALVLAAVGIFGMLSYMVSTRRREIGVRMALGARQGAVVGMIVRRGFSHALAGSALGLLAALAGARWMASSLYEVGAGDPATFAAATLTLLAVAAVACWLPARRAAAIDPAAALRSD